MGRGRGIWGKFIDMKTMSSDYRFKSAASPSMRYSEARLKLTLGARPEII